MRAIFISFPASDYLASKKFYEEVLGLPIDEEFNGEPHKFTNYDLGEIHLKLFEWKGKWFGSGHSGLFIETHDLDEAVKRISECGYKTTEITIHEWGGRCCSITDPFGNIFDLIDAKMKGNA